MTGDVQQTLQAALASLLEAHSEVEMARNARALSERYRLRTGAGTRLLTREDEAVAAAQIAAAENWLRQQGMTRVHAPISL